MCAFSLHIKWCEKQEYTMQYYGIAFLESQFSETEKWEDYS